MADIDDFDLDETVEMAWDDFSVRLAEVLSVMDDTSDLCISVAANTVPGTTPPVIKFSYEEPSTVAATLWGADPDVLTGLGWHADVDGAFGVRWDQEDTRDLALLVTRTMRDGLGAIHPVFLEPDQLTDILRPGLPVERGMGVHPGAHQP